MMFGVCVKVECSGFRVMGLLVLLLCFAVVKVSGETNPDSASPNVTYGVVRSIASNDNTSKDADVSIDDLKTPKSPQSYVASSSTLTSSVPTSVLPAKTRKHDEITPSTSYRPTRLVTTPRVMTTSAAKGTIPKGSETLTTLGINLAKQTNTDQQTDPIDKPLPVSVPREPTLSNSDRALTSTDSVTRSSNAMTATPTITARTTPHTNTTNNTQIQIHEKRTLRRHKVRKTVTTQLTPTTSTENSETQTLTSYPLTSTVSPLTPRTSTHTPVESTNEKLTQSNTLTGTSRSGKQILSIRLTKKSEASTHKNKTRTPASKTHTLPNETPTPTRKTSTPASETSTSTSKTITPASESSTSSKTTTLTSKTTTPTSETSTLTSKTVMPTSEPPTSTGEDPTPTGTLTRLTQTGTQSTRHTTNADGHTDELATRERPKKDGHTDTQVTRVTVRTSSTEKASTSSAASSAASSSPSTWHVTSSARTTTGCQGSIKVDDLRVVSTGQNNVTLTWQPPTSGVSGVYHVQVRGQASGGACVQYSVGAAGHVRKEKDGERKPRDEEACVQIPDQLSFVDGLVTIVDLAPCTVYDVIVTSDCPCDCDPSDTQATTSFITLRAPPGQVRYPQVSVKEKDSSSVLISWQPPPSPTCGLFKYLVRVLQDGACVSEIQLMQDKDSDYKDSDHVDQGGEEGFCKNPVNVYGNMRSPQVEVSGLLPDADYTLTINALNDQGMGPPTSRPLHTPVAVPAAPTKFGVVRVTSHSVTVGWRPPQPRPGPTRYNLLLMDMASPYLPLPPLPTTSSSYCSGGYHTTTCTVDKLRPYWRYNLTLTAHTAMGDSPPVALAQLVTTQPSAPGSVGRVEVSCVSDSNYTAVSVSWQCPDIHDRNTRVTGFSLRSVQQMNSQTNHTDDVIYLSSTNCDVTHSWILDVTPEHQYFFEVLTLGEDYNSTHWSSVAYWAPAGPSEAVSSVSVGSVGARNLTLQWSAPLVTNGQVTGYGVHVHALTSDPSCVRWFTVSVDGSDPGQLQSVDPPKPWPDCASRGGRDSVTVVPGNQSVTLTLTDLPPDTSLTLTVYPRNRAGWGLPRNITVRTLEAAPTAPTYISAVATNSTSLRVTWRPPQPRPGHTNYTLVLHRAKLLGKSVTFLPAASNTLTLIGWEKHEAVFTGLWSGWRYSLTIGATTAVGRREVQLDQPIQMPQSPPGQVQAMSVLPVASDYRTVRVTWDYPALVDRHGAIVNFTLCCQRVGSKIRECRTNKNLCQQTSPQFCATCDVMPGHNYTVTVQANNQYSGAANVRDYQARTGPPPALGHVALTSSASTSNSQSAFKVRYCATCLLNDSNGEITFIALLVCRDPYCQYVNKTALSSPAYVERLPSWYTAKGSNFQTLYRPTDDNWIKTIKALLSGGASRSATTSEGLEYTVGEEEEGCVSRDRHVHCNGPLPAGQSFRVMSVSCTSVACTTSSFSPSVHTQAPLKESGVPTVSVVGSVLGVVLGLLVVITFIVYRQRRRRQTAKPCDRSEAEGQELTDMTSKNKTVAIQDYEDKLLEWKSGSEASGLPSALVQQFAEIGSLSPEHSKTAAIIDENKLKNRYTNILPFDHTRVKLIAMDDDVTTDYINANYIPGYHSKREYIATQGPLQSTVDDFWRMVWEQRCPVIVMLSALTEGRLNKVYKYFPDKDELHAPVMYGMVTVTLQAVCPHDDYLVRTFRLTVGRSHREVHQFCVDSWRDFQANLNVSLVLDFVRAVRESVPPDNKHPLIVHCSAGVGRTGTWITIDYFMHYIRNNPPSAPIDIKDFVLSMRNCRVSMVQSVEQYVFIHDVVAELVRRKTEVDRYDEPVYGSQAVYSNLAYEQDSSGSGSNKSKDSTSSSPDNSSSSNKGSPKSSKCSSNSSGEPVDQKDTATASGFSSSGGPSTPPCFPHLQTDVSNIMTSRM